MKTNNNCKPLSGKLRKLCVLLLLTALFSSPIRAQQLLPFDTHLQSLSTADQVQLHALAFDEQTTAVASSSGISVAGNGAARVLDVGVADVNSVQWNDPVLAQVSLVRIRVDAATDLSASLDLSGISALNQLSCLLVLSTVDATAVQLSAMVHQLPAGVAACYSVSIPQ